MDEPAAPSEDADRSLPVVDDNLEDLYEDSPTGSVSSLLDGTIVRMNRTLRRWLQHGERAVGRFPDLLAPGDRIYHETHYAPLLLMQGEVRGIAVELVRADGSRLACMISSTLRPATPDKPAMIRTTVFDATDRRRYEHELLRAREESRAAEARAMALARTLQQSLIPPEPPHIPGLDVGAAYHPAGRGLDVGGDFYDVFEIAGGVWGVIMGDVSGKGAEAAGVTAAARYTARGAAVRSRRPSDVLTSVNQALLRDRSDRYCTMCYATVHPRGSADVSLTLSSGGHPLPLRVPQEGTIDRLGRSGTVLGAFDDVTLYDDPVTLRAGDMVVFYTDGLTDGRRGHVFFGHDRLLQELDELRAASAPDVARTLVERVVAYQDGWPRDDIAAVVLRVPR
jgi:sigma-B regulation protein RsbU (phosphoserine phosphatase)